MKKRQLGTSDLELTTVGLGTWAMGGGDWRMGWGPQEEADSIATILAAVDAGINWIDTAAVYGFGRSEEVVGKGLKQFAERERPLIATKCGRKKAGGDSDAILGDLSRDRVVAECEDSLKRLGVEVIDLYQLHWPVESIDEVAEGWQALAELKQAGKIRWGGVSNFNPQQLERCQEEHPVVSLQPPYSLFRRGIEIEILPWCIEHNIGVIAYSPMAKGMLTGKVTREWISNLPESDHRKNKDKLFQGERLEAALAQVDSLRVIAQEVGCSLANLAVAWVTHQEGVTAAIVGGRKPAQVAETAQAMDVALDESTANEIAILFS